MDTRKKIESFLFIRTYYQASGIYSPEEKTYFSLNKKVLLFSLRHTLFFILSLAHCLFEAKSIGDRAYSYGFSITLLWHVILFLVYPSQVPNTLKLTEKINEFICKSKVEFIFCSATY